MQYTYKRPVLELTHETKLTSEKGALYRIPVKYGKVDQPHQSGQLGH